MSAKTYDAWLGKSRTTQAYIDLWPAQALADVLDLPTASFAEELPELWHWLYFLEHAPRGKIGADGHPQKGDFLPPIDNPRRMFAGARTEYHRPLLIGSEAELIEKIANIQYKSGSQGDMVIVTVRYDYQQDNKLCISEERDFIYLPAAAKGEPVKPVETALSQIDKREWAIDLPTNPALLFRFSALTFNSHRIHYDLEYARQEENYPALVVHGPLTAILLSECARMHSGRKMKSFSFRALSPLFCGQTVRVRGQLEDDVGDLLAYNPAGQPAVKATVKFV